MSYLNVAILVLACFVAGQQVEATKTLNCEGSPYKSIKDLRTEAAFDPLRSLKQPNPATVDSTAILDAIHVYICNTVAKPALWITFVNSKIDMLYLAVLESMQKEDIFTYERPKKVAWGEFEGLLTSEQLTSQILASFAGIYSRVNLNKNIQLKNNDEIVDYNCRQLRNNFGPFFAEFQGMERITKNDQLIHNLAEFDENLQRLIVVYKTCQMMKF